MPELRRDPIVGRWVIIATERARRPDQFIQAPSEQTAEKPCPFCEGMESHTPQEIYAVRSKGSAPNGPGWDVRVIPSMSPFLRIEGDLDRRGKGIYDLMNGVGAHEIVVETNSHVANMADLAEEQIAKIIGCYISRIQDLERDERFKYVLVFKNYGVSAGGSRVKHSRSQLIATPVNPKRVKEELVGARNYFDAHERCIFCDLIRQEIEMKSRVIVEIDGFIAIVPFAARFPFEIWILPKKHASDFVHLTEAQKGALAKMIKTVLQKLKIGLNDPPYNYIIHTAPFRRQKTGYWRTISEDYHWHMEITPRLTRVAGFEWGTGFYICPVTPEAAAKYLQEVAT
ncbi:MAG TPA: galactose-1-phosphate uridylyltransferase [Candidatus Omnitrophota bacterium]|nr:galactose-1-phosphate uridylyltransferase [Candidatus Omnitrophota bacterium]